MTALLTLDRDPRLHVHLGPLEINTHGRGVFFFWICVVLLVVAGAVVLLSRRRELITRWVTWCLIAPVVGIPIWLGRPTTTLLAAVIAVVAVAEYARLVGLPRAESLILLILAAAFPVLAWLHPEGLAAAPLLALVCAMPSVLRGDTVDGLRTGALAAFGAIWICWSLAHLVVGWEDAFLVCFAAAAADVAAWCGGRGLRRFGWARTPLSPLSPNKTVGGVVGAVVGTVVVLALLGALGVVLVLAIAIGGVLGDLTESMAKRNAGVKDAGGWLPGFGGLLDRVDSLLFALPLAVILA